MRSYTYYRLRSWKLETRRILVFPSGLSSADSIMAKLGFFRSLTKALFN